jgi:hypothetical protein
VDREPLIFPIGHGVGARRVRRGVSFHDLSDAEFVVWTVAHGRPEALPDEQPWLRRHVLDAAAGVDDPAAVLDTLLERGLLVEVDRAAATGFARAHRVMPLMLGLGTIAEDRSLFGIGFLGQPVLGVGHVVYDLWQWSPMDDTLWATCESAAEVARRAGSTDPDYTDPDRLLDGFLDSLNALVCVHAACLDVPVRLGPATGVREIRDDRDVPDRAA